MRTRARLGWQEEELTRWLVMKAPVSGVLAGVVVGINPTAGARRFPADATEWAAAFPGIAVPTAIWGCQESASPLADGIGAVDLAESNTPLYQQAGDPLGRAAVGADATTDAFLAASAASLDIDDVTSLSVLVRFACPSVGGNPRGVVGKRQSSGGNGYGLEFTATGLLRATLDAGAVEASISIATPAHDDGVFHDALLVVDRGTQTISVFSELGSDSTSTAAVGSGTSTQAFRVLGNGFRVSHPGLLVSYVAVWVGTVLGAADLNTFRTPS